MNFDDIAYLLLLLFSISFGSIVKPIKNIKSRQLTCTVIGFVLLLLVSGLHAVHPIILTLINALIIIYSKKKFCHVICFVFCFTYLFIIRTSLYFGIPSPPEITNTALMIMVLKMVGLAFEINIYHLMSKSSDEIDLQKEDYKQVNLSFFEIVQYSFCYAGILVGPYYTFRTYKDMFYKPYSTCVPSMSFLIKRISIVPAYIILFLVSDHLFPLQLAGSADVLKQSFLYRVFYMLPWFFSFRMKIYVAFVLGECVCINLGLGAYPSNSHPHPGAGPTNYKILQEIEGNPKLLNMVKYNFESIRCMDEFASEFRPTIREGIRYWNMTVQYWLAVYIYKKTAASKPFKLFVTMFVSAIWHGVRPGYYLSLLGTPLLLISEIEVEKAFRAHVSAIWLKLYDFIWYFIKMLSLSYMGVAFILLDTKAILHYWSSIYYVGHIFSIAIFCMAFIKNKMIKNPVKKRVNI